MLETQNDLIFGQYHPHLLTIVFQRLKLGQFLWEQQTDLVGLPYGPHPDVGGDEYSVFASS